MSKSPMGVFRVTDPAREFPIVEIKCKARSEDTARTYFLEAVALYLTSESAEKAVIDRLEVVEAEVLIGWGIDEKIKKEDLTCFDCADKETCKYVFDAFNTDGDCLATK